MSAPRPADLLRTARAWADDDVEEADAALVRRLADDGDTDALRELFAEPLAFGTAGLRGPLRPGPAGMNRAVVVRTTAALCAWLDGRRAAGEDGAPVDGPVVVGRDARHGSERLAADAAAVVAATGRRVVLLPGPLPTPVVAFAVLHLGAAAGVVVTASHNPPQDNGYKVYLADGAQLVAPHDSAVAGLAAQVGAAREVPRDAASVEGPGVDVVAEYLDAVLSLVPPGPRELRTVYTPLHGVGRDVVLAALGRAGFPAPSVVAEQAEPDPDFPTVAFPNPEEEGALDAALARAQETGADLLLAHDPETPASPRTRRTRPPPPRGFRAGRSRGSRSPPVPGGDAAAVQAGPHDPHVAGGVGERRQRADRHVPPRPAGRLGRGGDDADRQPRPAGLRGVGRHQLPRPHGGGGGEVPHGRPAGGPGEDPGGPADADGEAEVRVRQRPHRRRPPPRRRHPPGDRVPDDHHVADAHLPVRPRVDRRQVAPQPRDVGGGRPVPRGGDQQRGDLPPRPRGPQRPHGEPGGTDEGSVRVGPRPRDRQPVPQPGDLRRQRRDRRFGQLLRRRG